MFYKEILIKKCNLFTTEVTASFLNLCYGLFNSNRCDLTIFAYILFRCQEPTNSTILEFYVTTIHGAILHQLLLALVVIILILFGLALYLSFAKEKKRRLQNPYVPLHGKHPLHNPVYITTVV